MIEIVLLPAAAILVVAPIYWTLVTSLRTPAQSFTNPPDWIPTHPMWSNYSAVFNSVPFWDFLLSSFLVTGASVNRIPGKGGGNAVDGYKAARTLFRRHPDLSLLFCATDRMAMGAYDYLKETGRRIPQDVAVVGFDNQWLIATQVRPTLTTIALPHYEIGKRAVELALAQPDRVHD